MQSKTFSTNGTLDALRLEPFLAWLDRLMRAYQTDQYITGHQET